MIRIIHCKSAAQTKAYFANGLSKADYYIDGQELVGHVQGKLAERLFVVGPVVRSAFHSLCDNRHPVTGDPLSARTKDNRRIGYDINFHCPKSVSILHGLSSDEHLRLTFEAAVAATMREIEQGVKVRIRKAGSNEDRQAGELIWTDFTHLTARPVEGCTPDPHLHAHCFVWNLTYDAVEDQIKAGQFGDIKRDMPFYQAMFHKRLSDGLMALGYQIRRTDQSFEVVGVPPRVLDLFSKRTDAIGRFAKEHGITDAQTLDGLGARTRAKKQKGLTMSELKAEWRRQILELGPDEQGDGSQAIRFAPLVPRTNLTAQQCVDHALLHGFERASVLAERRLLQAAFRHGMSYAAVSVESITEAFAADTRILRVKEQGRLLCTTREVLAEERRMVDLARAGFGQLLPLYLQAPDIALDGQQGEAVRYVLTTPHRVSIVRGAAGTGKTTLLRELHSHVQKAGRQMLVVAPTSEASRGVLRSEGFAGAETVAKLLQDETMQATLQGQVLVVDEAGLLGTRDMAALLGLVAAKDARLVLCGDTRQHASVVRGDALRILNTVAGIPVAEVSKIYRQRNGDYREAVEALARGDVKSGFNKLEAIGAIVGIDPLQPHERLVADYLAARKAGKSALVVSPTHAQGEAATDAIRKALRDVGLIGNSEWAATRLSALNLTEAERADVRTYQAGQIIQFNQNVPQIRRGSVWTVQSADDGVVHLIGKDGETQTLPLGRANAFEVHIKGDILLSERDQVRITRNGFDANGKRLNNGQSLEVMWIARDGGITLRNANSKALYELDSDFGHLAHAYCITSHAAQGKTVDEVFIAQPAATFPATDAKQFYVSVSRGKERCQIYTDDKAQLLEHAAEVGDRQSALELVTKVDMTQEATNRVRAELQREPAPEQAQPTPTPSKDYDYGHPRL